MDKIKSKKIRNTLYFLMPIIVPLLFVNFSVDSDTYWIIKTGEYICNNGIPTKDFLTMHSNMDLVVQQWLSDIIFYKLYSALGVIGLSLIVIVMYIAFSLLLYKFCTMMTNRRLVTTLVTLIANAYMIALCMVPRPQIFTYCIILIELIMLESYVRSGNFKYLIVLPFLSVLTVNLHASMWTMLFIMMLPYFANALPIKIKGKSISCAKILPLIITAVAMGVCGLITPYGYKGLTFIFTASVGNKVNDFIIELQPLKLSMSFNGFGTFCIVLAVAAVYVFHKKGKTNLRFALLTLGTGAMAMMYMKLIPYFIIAAYPTMLYYLDNADFKKLALSKKNEKSESKKSSKIFLCVLVGLLIAIYGYAIVDNTAKFVDYVQTNGANEETEELDTAVEVIENDSKKSGTDIVLFNGFNSGGYLEFKGYKTYIDARADSFVVEANHDFDYMTEYYNILRGKSYYKDFLNKYKFTYLIIEKGVEVPLYISVNHDSDYEKISDGTDYVVFKHVNN